ncbi:unnamed protein product [Calypogeia fissa]
MTDPWDWQDGGFKLDSESPLEITRCLWDELAHSEEDSRSLFSTPLTDIASQDPPYYSFRGQQDADSLEQRFDNSGLHGGGTSPRMKRRRLLFSEDPVYESCDTQLEPDSVIESFTDCIDPIIQVCSSGLQQSMDVNSLQTDSFWYRHCDDMAAPFSGVETGSLNWMAKSIDDGESEVPVETNTKLDPLWSGGQCLPQREEDVVQGPGTPLPGSSPLYNSDSNHSFDSTGTETIKKKQRSPHPSTPLPSTPVASSSTPYGKVTTPVAYPFTLLKPSETEGDITLKDINQRILMPPSRPLAHVQLQQQAVDESSSSPSPWSFGGCCSPTDPGLGLSGKSIVARTKIHTEGNGTITIMRTRG